MFYDNFKRLCNERGVSEKRAGLDMGFSNSVTQKWKKGSVPNGASLKKIAAYFNVDVSSLVADDIEQKEKATTVAGDGLSEKDQALLNWFRSLSPEKQKAILVSQDAPEDLL